MTGPGHDATPPADAGGSRRVSTAIVAGAAILAFLLACPCAIAAIFAGRHFVAESRVEYSRWVESSHRVAWSGEGRYGVAQVIGADGAPEVVSWDRDSGQVRRVSGYRLAAVERSAAVAWLVPITRQQLTERLDGEWGGVLVPAGGAFDNGTESLFAWELDTDEPVAATSEPAWRRWQGPANWSASAVIDPGRGAYPASVTIETTTDPAASARVTLPEGMETFDPVGWSPSGRYLALAEMLPSEGADADREFTRRLLVVDASQARVVSTAIQQVSPEAGPGPVWDESSDLLLRVDAGDGETAGSPSSQEPPVLALAPGGATRPAAEMLGSDAAEAEDVRAAGVHRSASDGVLLESAGSLVRWSPGAGRTTLTTLPPSTVAAPVYHRDGGWLVLAGEHDASGARSRDVLLHLAGQTGEWEAVWTGAWRDEEK